MSLFPAYTPAVEPTGDYVKKSSELSWLTNQSFIPLLPKERTPTSESEHGDDCTVTKASTSQWSKQPATHNDHHRKKKKKHHHKKHKRRSRSSLSSDDEEERGKQKNTQEPIYVSEHDYYTDVDGLKMYLTVEKLHRPACPKYRLGKYRTSAKNSRSLREDKFKRYYKIHRKKRDVEGLESGEHILERDAEMERALRRADTVKGWVELISYRQQHPIHLDSYQNHKRELATIERARRKFPDEAKFLRLYLDGIVKVHPTDEVLELIKKMISKDEANVLLWDALIHNKQGSMAQCIVPHVLRMYEKSIRALFLAKRSDETMLKLLKNCGIFCRQAGLWETLFGIAELALSLNVSGSFGAGVSLFASPEHYHQLIEYEELILRSGLPMNEIWLRIEKLRSAFHFLPYRGNNMCSDPQRMILQDDIVGFVYPLISKSYAFDLTILLLKLMKYPFERTNFEVLECFRPEAYEEDYSEILLPIFLCIDRDASLDGHIYNLIKELNTAPSYINANLAHESYLELLQQFLLAAVEHFDGERSAILSLLYLKLERILTSVERATGTLTDSKAKSTRSRVKNVLKSSKNQNDLRFYIEFGLLEYELTGFGAACSKIFNTSVKAFCAQDDIEDDNDLFSLVLAVVELLLKQNRKADCIHALTKLTLRPREVTFEANGPIADTTKLSVLQRLNDRVNRFVQEEFAQTAMVTLEEYFCDNRLINAVKAYMYYLCLIRSRRETMRQFDTLLFLFNEKDSKRHIYLREQIFEVYLKALVLQFDDLSPGCLLGVVDRILAEYPSNLPALRVAAFNDSLPWFRLRTVLGKCLTVRSTLLLVVTARIRAACQRVNDPPAPFKCTQIENDGDTYKKRVLNLLQQTTKSVSMRQNALLWRLYLRELFDQPTAGKTVSVLEQCRKTLYTALEACPWNKALYLDGAFFAPQELSQLLDLIMEKQLRIHAIPEELAILRSE